MPNWSFSRLGKNSRRVKQAFLEEVPVIITLEEENLIKVHRGPIQTTVLQELLFNLSTLNKGIQLGRKLNLIE